MPTINQQSGAVQELISRRAGFLERWGILLFLFILLCLLACTWLIRYPDIIQTSAMLTASNAPKEIVVRQEGKLVALFASNDLSVKQGQPIGWIESTADHRSVVSLSALLDTCALLLDRNETERVSSLFSRQFHSLGELQTAYQQFNTSLQQFNDYLINGYYYKRKGMLFRNMTFLLRAHQYIQQQQILNQQDLNLAQETYAANDSLFTQKVISRQDFREQTSKLVGKQLNIPQLETALLTNENEQTEKQKEIDELEHTINLQKNLFQQALQTLKSLVDEWKRKFILTAPIDGRVAFIVPLQENQYLSSGKTIGYINPSDSRYYAQIILPQHNFGKVDTGEKVQLRFEAYPYQEFGSVNGQLSYISKIPSDSGFLAIVALPGGLSTNYHKSIQYHSGLRSQAWIITRDTRLLQRFFNTLSSVSSAQR